MIKGKRIFAMKTKFVKPSWLPWAIGAVLLLSVSAGIFFLIVSGKTRKERKTSVMPTTKIEISAPPVFLPRRLDGVMVPTGQEAYLPRAVMVENHADARPLSGPAKAHVVIEAPVEGGITRFLLLFDATTTVDEVGPVRSARPYFVDWTQAWRAAYFHVGGSPESMEKIRTSSQMFVHVDEMGSGQYFWRSNGRYAPHNAYTSQALMTEAIVKKGAVSSTSQTAWHFQDMASSTDRGSIGNINIAYGGPYNVSWKYNRNSGMYARWQAGKLQKDKDGTEVTSENVVVIKTDAQVADNVGRLRLRTTGGGEAVGYRDGNKYLLRWRRGADEPIRFETQDGAEYLFTRGRVWIEITTDDRVYAGIGR